MQDMPDGKEVPSLLVFNAVQVLQGSEDCYDCADGGNMCNR